MLLLAECTHYYGRARKKKKQIVATEMFLAMGCPSVAPLSIIKPSAYLESKHVGYTKCTKGLRRIINDIVLVVDHNIPIISTIDLGEKGERREG